ncbi:MAG: 30S ribosomal protein S20 [Candidatus Levybacteria bacterium]|nr:30S ribosomal protein S20 [Candidatus Levybacteria bacterium]
MPVTKSANKKLRQDRIRQARNQKLKARLLRLIKGAKKQPTKKKVLEAIKTADKSAKKHLLHKNKAARIKSSLAKLL